MTLGVGGAGRGPASPEHLATVSRVCLAGWWCWKAGLRTTQRHTATSTFWQGTRTVTRQPRHSSDGRPRNTALQENRPLKETVYRLALRDASPPHAPLQLFLCRYPKGPCRRKPNFYVRLTAGQSSCCATCHCVVGYCQVCLIKAMKPLCLPGLWGKTQIPSKVP